MLYRVKTLKNFSDVTVGFISLRKNIYEYLKHVKKIRKNRKKIVKKIL